MSFKRDGDDSSLLKNLRHRRVGEILGDHIPDDEALLLSNGRLTCTICPKRPIFDTIQMLSIHRKGKNHLYELSRFLQHKKDLEYRRNKQIQKEFLKTGRLSVPTIEIKDSSLACIAQSLNQSKKRFSKFSLDRKFVLDISATCKIKNNISSSVIIEQSANSQVRHYLKSLPRKRSFEKTVNKLKANYGMSKAENEEKTKSRLPSQNPPEGHQEESKHYGKTDETQLKMLESGWIKDKNGKWVKDPNVEFDTDEDEPQNSL